MGQELNDDQAAIMQLTATNRALEQKVKAMEEALEAVSWGGGGGREGEGRGGQGEGRVGEGGGGGGGLKGRAPPRAPRTTHSTATSLPSLLFASTSSLPTAPTFSPPPLCLLPALVLAICHSRDSTSLQPSIL